MTFEAEFKEAMAKEGLVCLDTIQITEGSIPLRFKNNGQGNRDCWYFWDGVMGTFGDWRDSVKKNTWSAYQAHSKGWTAQQKEDDKARRQQQEQKAKQYLEEVQKKQKDIANKLNLEWTTFTVSNTADPDYRYLSDKKVLAYGIKYGCDQFGCFAAVPLKDIEGTLYNIQKIYNSKSDGSNNKWFVPGARKQGCFHILGQPLETVKEENPVEDTVYVCEGYATGASIHAATNKTVAIAFDAGNLKPVVSAIRGKYPKVGIILAADNDQWQDDGKNTGLTKAYEAAEKYQCLVVYPTFRPDHSSHQPTDFNDLHVLSGLEAVGEQLEKPTEGSLLSPISSVRELRETDEECFARLAALSSLNYDRLRKGEAKRLGIKVSTLDDVVKKHCPAADSTAGEKTDFFPVIEPWPEVVDPKALLEDLCLALKRFAVLPEHADTALALWIIFTWLIDHVDVAPILAISSPEKRCGKTTVLSLVQRLVKRPLPASNITPAALFRSIEHFKPTLLIDEADTFIQSSDELRGILNSGHMRDNAFVIRTVGDDHEPKQFSTWSAKAIALIGRLPDTLQDRSLVIPLRRKLQHETTEKLRHAEGSVFSNLQRKLLRFSEDRADWIKKARPTFLEINLSDRAFDSWEPLLAIAELAGPPWVDRTHQAAVILSAGDHDSLPIGTELLQDLQRVFADKGWLKVHTTDLIDQLCQDDESPWANYNKYSHDKKITPRQLSRLLSPYQINSRNIRITEVQKKGFEQSQFAEAWERYNNFSSTSLENAVPSVPASQMAYNKAPEGSVSVPEIFTYPSHPSPADFIRPKIVNENAGWDGGTDGTDKLGRLEENIFMLDGIEYVEEYI